MWLTQDMSETAHAKETAIEKKSPLRSKTVWMNIVAVISTLIPAVGEWLQDNPVSFVAALGAANVLVRFATKGKLSILGRAASLVALGMSSGLAALSFSSCKSTFYRDYGLRGSAFYRDADTGAKGGLRFEPGKPPLPWLQVPVETEDGEGYIDITSGK